MHFWNRRATKTVIILLLAVAAWAGIALRPAPAVEVVRPEVRDVIELVIASGVLRAVRQSDIGPEVAGTVAVVSVEEGDTVTLGQVLVELSSDDVEKQLEAARRALATAEAELVQVRRGPQEEEIKRAEAEVARAAITRARTAKDFQRAAGLNRQGLVSTAESDAAEAAAKEAEASERVAQESLQVLLRQPLPEDVAVMEARCDEARAAVQRVESELQKRTLRSPVAGLVVKRDVEPGASVTPGSKLLSIADMSNPEIYVETDENNLSRLTVGQKAIVVSPAYREMPFDAVVSQIGPEIDSARGVVSIRLTPATLPDYARPNMTVDVNVEVAHFDAALSVPLASVLQEPTGKAYIYELRDGVVARRDVELLGKSSIYAAVKGIKKDTLVVKAGTTVKVGQKAVPAQDSSHNV